MKPIKDWTDKEIEDKVNYNWKVQLKTDGKGLSPAERDIDRKIKAEYLSRTENGIECMLCSDNTVSYFDIMKRFCSDMSKISSNICKNHADVFNEKRKEFFG